MLCAAALCTSAVWCLSSSFNAAAKRLSFAEPGPVTLAPSCINQLAHHIQAAWTPWQCMTCFALPQANDERIRLNGGQIRWRLCAHCLLIPTQVQACLNRFRRSCHTFPHVAKVAATTSEVQVSVTPLEFSCMQLHSSQNCWTNGPKMGLYGLVDVT